MATKHSHGPNFGRHVDGCPRCKALQKGATPAGRGSRGERQRTGGYPTDREIAAHFAPDGAHQRGVCGPVCTFGDY